MPLGIIEKKDLAIAVRVAGIYGGNIAPGFDHDKATVTADAAGKTFGGRIGELAHDRIDLARDHRIKNEN